MPRKPDVARASPPFVRIIRQFIEGADISDLIDLWSRQHHLGWDQERDNHKAYHFTPCSPPEPLLNRALVHCPEKVGCGYLDCFFLHYSDGCSSPPHTDKRTGLRLNVCLIAPRSGGELCLQGQTVALRVGDAVVFDPSVSVHHVTKVDGERLIWSVGRTKDNRWSVKP